MNNEITVDGKTYVLKDEEKTYKIGDRFTQKIYGDVYMLIEYGSDEVNLIKLENPSGSNLGVGRTILNCGFKVKNKCNITTEEIENRVSGFFDAFELIEG